MFRGHFGDVFLGVWEYFWGYLKVFWRRFRGILEAVGGNNKGEIQKNVLSSRALIDTRIGGHGSYQLPGPS